MPKASRASKAPAKGFYAVHVGKTKGIYFTWPECEKQVKGFIGAKYKKFDTQKDAEEFVRNGPKVFTKQSIKSSNPGTSNVRSTPYASAAAGRSGSASASTKSTEGEVTGPSSSSTTGSSLGKSKAKASTTESMIIYTDGSSLSNGKQGSQAGVGVFFGVNDPRNISERLDSEPQTNQRAELMAVHRALEVCGSDTAPIEIRTDSMYTINIVTKWADGWIKNNWKRSDGDKVMNRDIIEPLIAKIKGRPGPIKWEKHLAYTPSHFSFFFKVHVRAHIGTF
ncbi:hypothetical protein BGZ99_003722, partial [Dissophora globulifera]